MKVLDGQKLSTEILKGAYKKIRDNHLTPRLEIIFIGDNHASEVYVAKKKLAGEQYSVEVSINHFDTITPAVLLKTVKRLAANSDVNGIIIQLPVPGFSPAEATAAIPPEKDVDGVNPLTQGLLWQGSQSALIPATPAAVLRAVEHISESADLALEEYIEGKNITIVNHSNIVGKPLAALLVNMNGTVTIAHDKTKDLNFYTLEADILVSGTGVQGLITGDMIKQDAVIIDVGFNRNELGIYGDVDKESVSNKAAWLTPVPGGVGPMGVAMLISNTVDAALNQSTL